MNAMLWRAVEVVFAGDWPAAFVARSTLLLAVAWLINAALGHANPRWRLLLWRGAAVSALALLLLGLARPVVSLALLPAVTRSVTFRVAEAATLTGDATEVESRALAWESERPVETNFPSVAFSDETTQQPASAEQNMLEVAPHAPRAAVAAAATRPWNLASFLWLAWGLGVLVAVGRNVLAFADLRRLRRGAKPASDAVAGQAAEIAARLGLSRSFEVLETDELQSPCVTGAWHAAMLLPLARNESPADGELAAVLAHEIEHLRNADLIWNAALLALSSLYWFHPLVWRMRTAHAGACDAVCDAAAANVLGDVEAYCRTLAELALRAWSRRSDAGLAMARPSSVRRRIVALRRCHYAAGLPRGGVVIAILVGVTAAGLLGTTRLIRAEDETESKAVAGEEKETVPVPAGQAAKPRAEVEIRGRISNESGGPVAGAYVQIYAPWSNYPKCSVDVGKHVTTDAEGRFTFAGLDPKFKFRLVVAADGYRSRFVDNVDPAAGQMVEATLTTRVMPDDPARVVRGVVIGPDGEPVVGATVEPFGSKAEGKRAWYAVMPPDVLAVTDNAGKFLLVCDNAVDALDLQVEAQGAARRKFALVESGPSDNRLTLTRGTTVHGRVVHDGHGVPGVAVGLTQIDKTTDTWLGPYATRTDSEGRFTFADVPPDQAMVVYGSMDSLRAIGALPFKPIESGSADSLDLGDLPVTPAHRVNGRIVLADGKPLPVQTRVVIRRENAWDSTFVEAGADGSFAFSGIPAELVELDIHNLSGLGYRMSPKNGSSRAFGGIGLEGLVSTDIDGLTVLVEPGKPLRPNFRKFDNAENDRFEHDARIRQEPLTGVTSELKAPPGAITLTYPEDEPALNTPPRPVARIDVPPPAPRPVFPPADATPARIVAGTVADAAGKPVADAQVWLPVRVVGEHEILTAKTRTNDSGQFRLSVPETWLAKPEQPNELLWNVWAFAPGHSVGESHAGRQLFGAAADEPLVITLSAESEIVLIIRSSDGKPAVGAKVIPCAEVDRVMRNYPRELSEKLLAETADAEGIVRFRAVDRESRLRPSFTVELAGHGRQTFESELLVSDGRQSKFQTMARDQRIELSPVGRIEGRIVGEQLELVRGKTVLVESDARWPRGQPKLTGVAEATIGDDGRFVIPEIAAGRLRVFIRCDKRLAVQPRPPKLFDINLEAGQTLQLEIPLERCVRVHGLVRVKETGDPVVGARVWINGRWLHNQGPSVITDEKGDYSAYLLGSDGPADKVDLEVDEQALVDYVQLSDPRARHVVPRGVDDFELPTIEMARAMQVSGLLLDAEGKPLAEAELRGLVDKRVQGFGKSDQEGRFTMGRVPAAVPLERFLVFSGGKRWLAETESTDPLVVRVKREFTNDD